MRTYFFAASILVLDGFVQGSGALSLLALIFIVPTLLLLSLLRWKVPADRKRFFWAGAVYGCAAGGALLLIDADSKAAGRRAEQVITACNEYNRRNRQFPPNLESLVPTYLATLPKARERARGHERFGYLYERTNASLFYVSSPLEGELRYDFAKAGWFPYD